MSIERVEKEKSARSDCATSDGNIPMQLIKSATSFIAPKEKFTTKWKTTRINPKAKVRTPIELANYRPMSVLPALFKIHKKLVMKEVAEFMEHRELYQSTQPGLRTKHTTLTLLIKFADDIINVMNKGEITIAIFADITKAFDTIGYAVQNQKSHSMNFSKYFIYWLVD